MAFYFQSATKCMFEKTSVYQHESIQILRSVVTLASGWTVRFDSLTSILDRWHVCEVWSCHRTPCSPKLCTWSPSSLYETVPGFSWSYKLVSATATPTAKLYPPVLPFPGLSQLTASRGVHLTRSSVPATPFKQAAKTGSSSSSWYQPYGTTFIWQLPHALPIWDL